MSHTPHELHEEFPEYAEKMSDLKTSDAHFAKLFEEYHEVNRAIHGSETHVKPTDQFHEAEMRKERGALKDQLYRMLTTD